MTQEEGDSRQPQTSFTIRAAAPVSAGDGGEAGSRLTSVLDQKVSEKSDREAVSATV